METKIASYQEPGIRVQLVRIEKEDIGTDGMPTALTKIKYQVRVNRKIVYSTEYEEAARRMTASKIYSYIIQQKINYEC